MLNRVASDAVEVGTVKLVDQFPIFELGGALRHLIDLAHEDAPSDPFQQLFGLWGAEQALSKVLDGEQPLAFCRGAAMDLIGELRKQRVRLNPPEEGKQIAPLASWELHSIKTKIEIFEHQLSAELKKTASYAVPARGIFNIELLAEHAERHIHETIRLHLSDFTIAEYQQAGRCLAFGQYSACGFHAARAVEDQLRVYFERFLGPAPEESMGLLAGKLSDLLRSKDESKLKPRENTVRHIKDLTNFDRNPLVHRRVALNEVDATTFFNNALSVLGEMVKELLELDDSDRQQPLALTGSAELIGSDSQRASRRRVTAPLRIPGGSSPSS